MNILIIVLIIAVLYWFIYRQNNKFDVSRYYVPADVKEDISIVHLSDLHGKKFGQNNEKLMEAIKPLSPDMIVITGDIIHKWGDKVPEYVDSIAPLTKIAPVYAIAGNHEMNWPDEWPTLRDLLRKAGIRVLENDVGIFSKNEQRVSILGLNEKTDPDTKPLFARLSETGGFKLVLSHYPLTFEDYCKRDFNLQLSGHAHGGQFRLPVIGGIFSPDQGFFPHYDSGIYEDDGRMMIVSRGLGNSEFPVRLFNHPDIVYISVTKKETGDN